LLQQTAAAITASRNSLSLSAAAAAERRRSMANIGASMTRTRPKAVSPVIDGFLACWQGDERFLSLLPPVAGTKANKKVEEKRTFKVMDWVVREFTPTWLSHGGSRYRQCSDALRRLAEIDAWESLAGAIPTLIQASRLADEHMRPLLFDESETNKDTVTNARDLLWGVTKPGSTWWHQAMWQSVPDKAAEKAFKEKALKRHAQVVWIAAQNAALESARIPEERPDAWVQIRAAAQYAAMHPKTYRYDDEFGGEVPDKDLDLTTAAKATQVAALSLGLLAAKNGAQLAASDLAKSAAVGAFHAHVFPELVMSMRAAAAAVTEPDSQEAWEASQEAGFRLVENRWQKIVAQLQEPAARLIGLLVKISE
jgi:hypothetical protein